MLYPFDQDVKQLKDSDIEEKISDLTKKYNQAYRLGKPDIMNQISVFLGMYREEMSLRYAKKTEMIQKKLDGDIDQLINID
jgi:hypothetical protein